MSIEGAGLAISTAGRLPYGVAAVLVGVSALVWWLIGSLLQGMGLYLSFVVPVAASAYLFSAGPCILTIGLSATAAVVLRHIALVPDRGEPALLALFLIESSVVTILIQRLKCTDAESRT